MQRARRSDIRNSFTEKCENCTTRVPLLMITETRLEQADSTASSWSSHRQSAINFGIPPVLKSNARTSASSSTRSGRLATARHCKSRYACSPFTLLISFRIRLYVSSSDLGNSSRVRRRLVGKQCRRTSNWQKTHRNLFENIRRRYGHDEPKMPLHSICFLCQFLNDHILIIVSPSLHLIVRAYNRSDIINNVLLLSAFVVEGYLLSRERPKRDANVELWTTRNT